MLIPANNLDRKFHLKYTHRSVMADWIHKEENFTPAYELGFTEGQGIGTTYCRYEIIDNLPVSITKDTRRPFLKNNTERKKWEKNARDIVEWWEARPNLTLVEFLDLHCVGGWELFKISKEFRGSGHSWCIFRRKN